VTEQRGAGNRDQFNTAGDTHITHIHQGSNPDDLSDDDDVEDYTGSGSSLLWPAVMILVVGIVLALALHGCSGSDTNNSAPSFPIKGSHWPQGATATMVLKPIAQEFNNCSQVHILDPVNCPQFISDSSATSVSWFLRGNPTDGARIVYKSKQFLVAGIAVME
jgi:hypothetical protein